MKKRNKIGFIVHPFETSNNKYSASYGNHNRTAKSFRTLKQAKSYLTRHKIEKAMYDSPTGAKIVRTLTKRKRTKKSRR